MGTFRKLLGHRLCLGCLWLCLDLRLVLAACLLLGLSLLGLVIRLLLIFFHDHNFCLGLRFIIILRHRVPPGGFLVVSGEVDFHFILNLNN